MQYEFERAGVWRFLTKGVPVASYGHPKDPFKFDFGYKIGKELKLFHAVSMSANVEPAVLLAARYQKIAPVMAQMTSSAPSLIAVIEPGLDKSRNEIGFAMEMMEESRIRVVETPEMLEIARVAKTELGA